MGTWVHGKAIADFARDLLHAAFNSTDGTEKATLAVKWVSLGKLYQHVMSAARSSDFPCVLVAIEEPSPQDAIQLGMTLQTMYQVRVVLADQFGSAEKVEEELMDDIEIIANYLQDSADKFVNRAASGNMSLTAGLATNMRLNGMEYAAPEAVELRGLNARLVAAACNFLVVVESTGS